MMLRKLISDKGASSAAEFALLLPMLLIFLLGTIDVGRWMWTYNRAQKATQVGARVAAVTDMIPGGLAATEYVGQTVSGVTLTQGDRIPAAALGVITCSKPDGALSCSCTTDPCPATLTPYATDGFDLVFARMHAMMPEIADSNIQVLYSGSGLGFAGDPNGSQIAPLITVRVTGLQFVPITSFLLATFNMPSSSSTMPSEDLSGDQSN